ncbi:MAG: NlpC/P60 family protein [Georgfuchsia sp.]
MIYPEQFILAARAYVDAETPFMHQGRGLHGLDCIGLIVVAARQIGISIGDRTDYPRDPNGLLQPALTSQMLAVDHWMPGDVLLMRFGTEPQHVGIFTGTTLIHAYSSARKVVEHRIDARWSRRVVYAYRFLEFCR